MLNAEENRLLTQTGPGTPMGEYFRRFWLPALHPDELPAPDCPPVRLRLLGEDLVAFRDSRGRVGLLDAYCPHRGAHLFFGRNEHCGLRCVYHGWQFDVEGRCLDMPNEPPESTFKERMRTRAYPTREYGGFIWAYLGPPERTPALPAFEWALAPPSHRHTAKWLQESNWLQNMEAEIDTAHVSLLHRWLDPASAPYADQPERQRGLALAAQSTVPFLAVEDTPYGLRYGARRDLGNDSYYWRVTQWLLPMYSLIPHPDWPRGGRAWVPVDDAHTFIFDFSYAGDRPLSAAELADIRSGTGVPPDLERTVFTLPDGARIDTWRPLRNRENDYLLDRAAQRTRSFTGIHGVNDQDRAVVESMGAVVERDHEHLVGTDKAIIAARRRLLREVTALQHGEEPAIVQDGAAYAVRPLSVEAPEADLDALLARCADELQAPAAPRAGLR